MYPLDSKCWGDEPVRVVTYNIRYDNPGDSADRWENRRETVVDTISGFDLVGLQEVLASQQDDLERTMHGWEWGAVGRDDGLRRGEMVSVGWRTAKLVALDQGTFWLSEHPDRVGRPGWDAALPRIATWVRLARNQVAALAGSSPTLLVVNTHFDHRGAEARRQSAALLRRWVAENRGTSDVLLLGDLNDTIGSPSLDTLLAAGDPREPPWRDARACSDEADPGPDSTWNGFSEIAAGRRIDHVLVSGARLRVVSCETLDPRTPAGRFASDHLPVAAVFSFP